MGRFSCVWVGGDEGNHFDIVMYGYNALHPSISITMIIVLCVNV